MIKSQHSSKKRDVLIKMNLTLKIYFRKRTVEVDQKPTILTLACQNLTSGGL